MAGGSWCGVLVGSRFQNWCRWRRGEDAGLDRRVGRTNIFGGGFRGEWSGACWEKNAPQDRVG